MRAVSLSSKSEVPVNELEIVSRANPAYVDDLYARWVRDPASVDEHWALFFAGFEMGATARLGAPAPAPAAVVPVLPPNGSDSQNGGRAAGGVRFDTPARGVTTAA